MNIKKAAEMFDLSVDTLRYYERVGVIPPVQRNESGYRVYTTNDLNWIYLAKHLRNAGLSIESLIEFAQLAQVRESQNVEKAQKQILADQLEELEKKLAAMQEVRDLLIYKIETYDEHIAKFKAGNMTPDKVEKLWERKKEHLSLAMDLTPRFRIEHAMKIRGGNIMQTITLNNGVTMPQLGFGVYQIPLEETAEAVYQAIKAGYRLIDTASIYGNETETGEGIKRAITEGLVTREELFVTSKLFILQASEDKAKETIEHSLETMGLTYLDLYLIHQPYGDIYGAWRSMVAAQKTGKLRAIGVSNFKSAKMIEFVGLNEVKPQINQIEVNPWNQRVEDQEWHEKYDVQVEAWAPFAEGRHDLFTNPTLAEIGTQYGKTVGQVVLRWLMQRGIVALAKTVRPERMAENIAIFDFELSQKDIEKIAALDKKESAFFDHDAPQQVEWFMVRMLDTEN